MSENKNKVVLGDPKCFAVNTRSGIATSIRADVSLSKDENHFCLIHGKPEITAKGYNRLNQVAGVSIIGPRYIGDKPNPYIDYDDENKTTTRVITRKIAIGLSPIGSLSIIDEIVNFDVESYLRQEAFSKWQKYRNMGDFVTKPKEDIANKVFIPIIGNKGILLDMFHQETINLINNYETKEKFASRIADSIARRNCLKAHPAIATSSCRFDGPKKIIVTVYGFKHEYSRNQLEDIKDQAANGQLPEGNPSHEVITHDSYVGQEDLVSEDVGDPEQDGTTQEPDDINTHEGETIIQKIINLRKAVGGEFYDKTVPDDIFDMSEEKQQEVLNILGKEVLKRTKRI